MSKRKLWFCLVPILTAALAGRVEAACDWQDRIALADSGCMTGSFNEGAWRADNVCSHTIRVKIDVKNGRDKTKNVAANTSWRGNIDMSWGRRVRGVYCCSDYAGCHP